MKKISALAVMLALLTTVAYSKSLVREFSGTGMTTTGEFSVQGPWLLDWRLDGDHQQLVALEITLIESRSGRHIGQVLRTQYIGNGVKLFEEGGVYRLRISSTLARWRVKIEQISREEAEQYTPRGEGRSTN